MSTGDLQNFHAEMTMFLEAQRNAEPKMLAFIKAEIAERALLKCPQLILEENREALLLFIEMKYDEISSAISEHESMVAAMDHEDRRRRERVYGTLEKLGVVPRTELF